MVGRNRRVVVAGGDAEAAREVFVHLEVQREPHAQEVLVAVLINIQLGRKLVAGGVEGSAGVDRVEIRKRASRIVAVRKIGAGVTEAQVERGVGFFNPWREFESVRDLCADAVCGEFEFDLFFDLVADGLGDVGHADVARRGSWHLTFGGGGARHDLNGGGFGDGDHLALVLGADGHGFGLGLLDHVIGLGLGEDAALHEFVDEVDRDIAGRGVGGIGTRAEWRRCWGGSGLVVGLGLGGEGFDALSFLHGDFRFSFWRDDGKGRAFGGSLGLCRRRSGRW